MEGSQCLWRKEESVSSRDELLHRLFIFKLAVGTCTDQQHNTDSVELYIHTCLCVRVCVCVCVFVCVCVRVHAQTYIHGTRDHKFQGHRTSWGRYRDKEIAGTMLM